MHKTILMILLVVISSSEMAEWVFVTETEEEDFSTFYADPVTIRKSGNNVKMCVLNVLQHT
jgi:hypothetical protein